MTNPRGTRLGPTGPIGPTGFTGPTGPVGPVGPPGASGAGFVYLQPIPSLVWTINHNLGFEPSVSITDVFGAFVEAEVLNVSTNVTVITFLAPLSGKARLV